MARATPPYTFEQLGFPPEYLVPIQTPHGNMWPGPRVRMLLEDIENIQKRMVNVRLQANPQRLARVMKKKDRQPEYDRLKKEFEGLQKEMGTLTDELKTHDAAKEQFQNPMEEFPVLNGNMSTRVETEKWKEQYEEASRDRLARIKEEMKAHGKKGEDPSGPPPKLGTFLQV